jgi:hypothetical protein
MNFANFVINLGLLQEWVYNQTKGRRNIPWENMGLERVLLLAMSSFILKFPNVESVPSFIFQVFLRICLVHDKHVQILEII